MAPKPVAIAFLVVGGLAPIAAAQDFQTLGIGSESMLPFPNAFPCTEADLGPEVHACSLRPCDGGLCPMMCVRQTNLCNGVLDCPPPPDGDACAGGCMDESEEVCGPRSQALDCFSKGRTFKPEAEAEVGALSVRPVTVQSARICQKLCKATKGCSRFVFGTITKKCIRQACRAGGAAISKPLLGAISGPAECGQAPKKTPFSTSSCSLFACLGTGGAAQCGPGSSLCLDPACMCNGQMDCPNGADEEGCNINRLFLEQPLVTGGSSQASSLLAAGAFWLVSASCAMALILAVRARRGVAWNYLLASQEASLDESDEVGLLAVEE